MTGLDVKWEKHPEVDEKQSTVMVIYFRPDIEPKSRSDWYRVLSNYCDTMAKILEACPKLGSCIKSEGQK